MRDSHPDVRRFAHPPLRIDQGGDGGHVPRLEVGGQVPARLAALLLRLGIGRPDGAEAVLLLDLGRLVVGVGGSGQTRN